MLTVVGGGLALFAISDLVNGKPILGIIPVEASVSSSVNSIMSSAINAINTILNSATTQLNNLPPPTPTVTAYDNYPALYDTTKNNTLSPNGKWLLVYKEYNPSNPTETDKSGVTNGPSPDGNPRVYYAQPYITANTST